MVNKGDCTARHVVITNYTNYFLTQVSFWTQFASQTRESVTYAWLELDLLHFIYWSTILFKHFNIKAHSCKPKLHVSHSAYTNCLLVVDEFRLALVLILIPSHSYHSNCDQMTLYVCSDRRRRRRRHLDHFSLKFFSLLVPKNTGKISD